MKKHLGLVMSLIIGIIIFSLITRNSRIPQLTVVETKVPSSSKTLTHRIKGGEIKADLHIQEGFSIRLFADNIIGARDLLVTPSGVVLVSSSATGNVYALPDKDHNGIADEVVIVVSGLNNPHGLAIYKNKLYIAETRRVSRFVFSPETLKATFEKQLFSLPPNTNHNKRTIEFDNSGNLYTSVGSTCNVCEETDDKSGTVLISDSEGDNLRIFSKGLRNAPFLALNPDTGEIWSSGMGRDYLGDNLPPDEINILKDGADYGWPYCYGNKVFDSNFNKKTKEYCEDTIPPLFQIPAHSAPLGLAFIPDAFSDEMEGDLLTAYHGSWNRSIPDGYKVVHLKVEKGKITHSEDFISGFIKGDKVQARPVDVAFDEEGYGYVSDDKSGNIYIISPGN